MYLRDVDQYNAHTLNGKYLYNLGLWVFFNKKWLMFKLLLLPSPLAALSKGVFVLLTFIASNVYAVEIEDVLQTDQAKIGTAKKAQKSIDSTFKQAESLFMQFQQVNKEVEGLKIYNAQLNQQIDSQNKRLKELDESIDKVTVIERQITPLTLRMIDTLEQFIALDMPFHIDERRERITLLRDNFPRAEITIAEKFRQVLEAYKIEREYGRKIDRYSQIIDVNDQKKEVNVLRIGRLALLFETADQQTFGFWNSDAKQWQLLDDADYRRAINHGLRMASKQTTVDLLTIPISAPSISANLSLAAGRLSAQEGEQK